MSTSPFLTKIGLSETEQKVYLSLLGLGPLSAGEISKYTGVKPISSIKTILEKLFGMGYAYNIDGLVDKAIGLYPFAEIAAEAENDAKKIDQLVTELKKFVDEQIQRLTQVMKETEDFVRAEKKKNSDRVSQNSNESRAIVDAKVAEATQTVTTTVDSTIKSVTSSANSFLNKQTETADTFETTTNENMATFGADLKSKAEAELQTLSSEIKTSNDAFLADGTSTIESTAKTIASKTNNMGKGLKDDSKTKLDGTRDHLLNGLESFVSETEGNVGALNSNLAGITKEQADSITATTNEAKKNRIDLNNQFKTGIAESFQKVKGDIAKDFDGFQNKFASKLESIANKFKKQIDDLRTATAKDVALLCEEATVTVTELANKHNEEIAANVDLDNKAVEDGTASMLAKVNATNKKATSDIGKSIETMNSNIVLLKATYSGDINSQVDETITSMHTAIDGTVQETKEAFNATKDAVVQKLSTLTSGNTSATAKTATKQTGAIKTATDSLVEGAKTSLAETKGALLDETKKAKNKIANTTKSGVDTIGTTATTTLGETGTQAKTAIRSNEETTIGAIEAITGIVETAVRKEIETVRGGLDGFYKRFARDAVKISETLREFRDQHQALQTVVKEFPRPRIETTILYSKEAIFERLSEIITTRIKSNVTMVIPDPTDIPTKAIAQVKQHVKITIISKIDEVGNKAIIDEIKASDTIGRIKIRKIGMQDMIGYSEYLAFDIDGGEEMLIAFKDETEKDWVGVLSTADGFKNVVIGETLGRQALSISRELKY
jgi:sugar-specific transcriptional regulator TrmB